MVGDDVNVDVGEDGRKVCWLERVEGFDELNSLTLSTGLILT